MTFSDPPVRLDLISVATEVREELSATAADLYVSVVGESFFTGSAAMTKTREVNDLLAALAAAGIGERDVHLQSVRAFTSTGRLRKSSAAKYYLRVHCPTLETVSEAMAAIMSQKNTDLRPIVWRYPDAAGLHDRLLDVATRKVHERAKRIVANLGIRLAGVHRYDEKYFDPEANRGDPFAGEYLGGPGATIDKTMDQTIDRLGEELGMTVSHLKEVRLRVEVDYYVSDYVRGDAPPA